MNKDIKIELPDAVKEIFKVIREYGSTAYIVGGSVRDSIMGRPVHDWDICTPVTINEIFALFETEGYKVIPTGIQHGTVTVMIDGVGYEITTYRRDGEYSDGRHPDFVEFTSNLIEDLSRRDFTINAMAYNEEDGLIDPFNGMQDIEDHFIRCVGLAKDRFTEDALRILRAMRFASQLEFVIDAEASYEISHLYKSLENISVERINSEFCKMIVAPDFCIQMVLYKDVLAQFIPEIRDMFGFEQNNPYHIDNVWNHTVHAIEHCDSDDLITCLAVFFHDIGKPHCYTEDENGVGHFKGHGRVSADMTDKIMKRLRFDNDTREKVVQLVYYHDATFEVGEKYIKRWLNKIGEEQFRRLLELRKADISAQNPLYKEERLNKIQKIEEVLENILSEAQCFTLKDLAVNGNDVMKYMGCSGKIVGYWLNHLLDMVINGEIQNEPYELISYMKHANV